MSWHVLGDWGTSKLRLLRIVDGVVVERRDGPGIGSLREAPEAVLRSALAAWRAAGEPATISLCGMVGSRNGWREVAYADCPADAAAWSAGAARLALDAIPVTIAAGLATTDAAGTPDVMRGEETQLFGAIAIDPALGSGRHLIALPGTHSKWAMIEDGRITGFRTFLTGELFALLRDHSTLTRAGGVDDGDEEASGFRDGVRRAAHGNRLLGRLFEARSAQLRSGRSASWATGFLSGLVIGSEIGEALADIGSIDELVLICDPRLAERYALALATRDVAVRRLDGDACALTGLGLLEAIA